MQLFSGLPASYNPQKTVGVAKVHLGPDPSPITFSLIGSGFYVAVEEVWNIYSGELG